MTRARSGLQAALFLLGLGLFVWVLRQTGLQKLDNLIPVLIPILSGPGVLVLAFYPIISLPDAWGWYLILARDGRIKNGFRHVFLIRIAGEGVNGITPFLDIGGEFLKVSLISKYLNLPRRLAVASVILARSALFFSEILFWILGFSLIFVLLTVPGSVELGFGTTLAVFVVICLGLALAQKKGLFSTFGMLFEKLGLSGFRSERFEVPLKDIDDEIRFFYGRGGFRWARVIVLHYAGWMAGSVESYFMLHLLGVNVSIWEAVILEAVMQFVRSASFFIPANMGTQEAGLAFASGQMGIDGGIGVALSLLKRLRQILWTIVGFGILSWYQWVERHSGVKTAA